MTWTRLLNLALVNVLLCSTAERGMTAHSEQSLEGGLQTVIFAATTIYWAYRTVTDKPDPGREPGAVVVRIPPSKATLSTVTI